MKAIFKQLNLNVDVEKKYLIYYLTRQQHMKLTFLTQNLKAHFNES